MEPRVLIGKIMCSKSPSDMRQVLLLQSTVHAALVQCSNAALDHAATQHCSCCCMSCKGQQQSSAGHQYFTSAASLASCSSSFFWSAANPSMPCRQEDAAHRDGGGGKHGLVSAKQGSSMQITPCCATATVGHKQ